MELAFGTECVQAAVIPRGCGARPHAAHCGFVIKFPSVSVPPQAAPIGEVVASDCFAFSPLLESEETAVREGH